MYQNSNYNNGYSTRTPLMPTAPSAQVPMGLKGRPVSSLEEVRAAQIDFDGSIFIFPDVANKRIYTKQINLDGTASLNMYTLAEIPKAEDQYITRIEFNQTLEEIKNALFNMAAPAPEPEPEASNEFNF